MYDHSPVRPWEYGQIDAFDWMETLALRQAYYAALAEVESEAAAFKRPAPSGPPDR